MKKTILVLLLLVAPFAYADEADVIDVVATAGPAGKYRFDVTVRHADEGWDHYANKWDIIGTDGATLGSRVLYHPHVNEQPFTRSLPGVEIPPDTGKVTVRAHDSVHGYGGKVVEVNLGE